MGTSLVLGWAKQGSQFTSACLPSQALATERMQIYLHFFEHVSHVTILYCELLEEACLLVPSHLSPK